MNRQYEMATRHVLLLWLQILGVDYDLQLQKKDEWAEEDLVIITFVTTPDIRLSVQQEAKMTSFSIREPFRSRLITAMDTMFLLKKTS